MTLVALSIVLSTPSTAIGQSEDRQGRGWDLTTYVGAANDSPSTHFLGITPDRDHLFVGLQANLTVKRTQRWRLDYAPQLVPLLVVSDNPKYADVVLPFGKVSVYEGTGPVSGFGVSPVAFESQLRINGRWRAYSCAALGVVWFTRDVPVPAARSFNFTLEGGLGVMWQLAGRSWVRVGYKLHHLSNGYSAPENPGLDGHVFLVGLTRRIGT